MKIRYLVLIILLAWAGCKKENEPPIIEPGPYYPVYPDSWWIYLINGTIVQRDTTSDDYMVHSFKIDGDPDRYSDPARVPFVNGNPVYGYYYVESVYMPTTYHEGIQQLWPILYETVGSKFWMGFVDHRFDRPCELATVQSKTFNGTDSLLLLKSGWSSNLSYDHYIYPEVRYRTFAKGVGCISDILVDTVTSDTLSRKILIDYHVNWPGSIN